MGKFYLTTPIYYVNDRPHIGHAYTTVLADAIARQRRLAGDEVHFLTGTDEHGDKVEKAARKRGMTPQELADETAPHFSGLWKRLSVTHDDFIRTTETRHKAAVSDILARLYADGHFYAADYEGWYCTPCERYWTEKDLLEGNCPNSDCKRPVQQLSEKNWFFKMGRHQQWLIDHINAHPDFIQPESRKNEVLGFLKQPLGDLCVSRPKARLAWGIELPFDREYVTYVWFDALLNYITAVGYPFDMEKFHRWWPADLHLVGKDIVTTHAVYWPTMLAALGLPLPRTIYAHGWWLSGGAKMSKSKGNVLSPMDILDRSGPDPFRYFLLKEMTLGADAAFTPELFATTYNADLANNLGNYFSRTLTMTIKYCEGAVPQRPSEKEKSGFASAVEGEFLPRFAEVLRAERPGETLRLILSFADRANRRIEEVKPWALAKTEEGRARLPGILYELCEFARILSSACEPFLPGTVQQMRDRLGLAQGGSPLRWGELAPGAKVATGAPLFPRMEVNGEK